MKIIGLNLDVIWNEKFKNFAQIEQKMKNISGDLLVLPEMFSSGFCMNPELIADKNNETLNWMLNFSKIKNIAIVGSVSVFENEKYYNRAYFVMPNGEYKIYDKRHLFGYSDEDKIYEKGKNRVVVDYQGVRFLLQICYDLRFPVFSRNQKDYDVALYLANWPKVRTDIWRTLLKARAIENQVYVFGVNRIGKDANLWEYEKSSECYFPNGALVSREEKDLIFVDLEMDKLNEFRKKYNFLPDADDFCIK